MSAKLQEYIAVTRRLAQHFGQPFAESAIRRGIPNSIDGAEIAILVRMLSAVGLKSRLVTRKVDQIDPVVLPCILFSRDGELLLCLERRDNLFTVERVAGSPDTRKVPVGMLRIETGDQVLLVTRDTGLAVRSSSRNADATSGHWFWTPVRENRGAWLQILVTAIGINMLGLALPLFVMNVYDRVIPNLAITTLWTLAAGVVIALLLDLVLKVIRSAVLDHAGRRIDMVTSAALFRQALNLRLSERPAGSVVLASQIRDFESIREFLTSGSLVALIDLAFIGLFLFVMWIVVGPLSLVALAAVPAVLAAAFLVQIPMKHSMERAQRLAERRHQVLIESLTGLETIKSLNSEPVMQREWENAVAAGARLGGVSRFWSAFIGNITLFAQQAVSVVTIVWGVYLVADGRITVGALIAANLLAGRVLAPLGNISQTLLRAQHARRSYQAISALMKSPGEASDVVRSSLTIRDANLTLNNVGITYPGAKLPTMTGVTLSIASGESIGLLGRVGTGKSTLGKVISGLVPPTTGIVLVDGYEISQYEPSSIRDGIGYLPQDPELFTGTIYDNLLIGKPDAGEEEIRRALYLAGMDYFISEHPEGLQRFVGEKGNRLSGGQRQAISLARLILRRPRMMFLDEPTNAMDHTTEAVVISRLKELQSEGTALVIATHRISLTAIVDRLVVLEGGRIAMDGGRDEVLSRLSRAAPTGPSPASRAAE